MGSVAIIDSGGANLASLGFALQRLGADAFVTNESAAIKRAERVILPGVGSAAIAMQRLRDAQLTETIRGLSQPVIGICLGMQLLFDRSEEGAERCLGVIPGNVQRIAASAGLPVPHMGWNQLALRADDPLLRGIELGAYVYFVHSYAVAPAAHTLATTDYGTPLAAVVRRENFWGTQFHPERSSVTGAKILKNFLELQ
jgi:glutamine amidotransferase